ncbi:MAG: hypothetical protein JWM95_3191 [Gemmatimonadetes bacterium]|nr:hypothetical protein [Gemmatimonadota bacterium]
MRIVRGAVVILLAAVACGGDKGVAPSSPYSLAVAGRTERGLTAHVGARSSTGDGSSVAAVSALAASPADAVTIAASGDVQFTKAGVVVFTATAPDGTSLSLSVTVATPPLIVFDGRAAGNRDIYRVALDGTSLTRLTTNAGDDARPTVAGDVVLYSSFRDGNAELYSLSLATGVERRLTTSDESETQPSIAPDAKHVLYTTNASGVSKIWIASLNLAAATTPVSGAARLAVATFGSPSAPESSPTWAPASDKIAFVSASTNTGSSGLFTSAATAGATPVLVTGSGTQGVEVEPAWSPDGFRLAYAAVIGGATEIFVRDLRTNATAQITRNTASSGQPAWLSDGRIVFTTFSGNESSLRWVDPAIPFELHAIPVAALSTEHSAAIR